MVESSATLSLKTTILRRSGVTGVLLAIGLSLAHPVLANSSLERATITYRNVGGHDILADVYRPKGTDVRPVIVYIHGGALIMGNREITKDYPPQVLSFAEQRGYAIVSIDYRLAPETKLPAIISDIEAAFTWLGGEGAKRFHLDIGRMVVVGDSAGGYLTLVTGYRVKPQPRALVALYGYGELSADWYAKPNLFPGYTDPKISKEDAMHQTDGTVISDGSRRKGDGGKIYMYYRQNGLWLREVSGFNPESLARDTAPYEPAKNVTREYPPTLMIHGTWDMDVPFEESLNMSEQLKKHGVPYILRPVDKGGHGFGGGDPAQIEDAYSTMREFMLRYLEAK